MIREKVKVENYQELIKKHDYFIWHFLIENQGLTSLHLHSYFDNYEGELNIVKEVMDLVPTMPYYESMVHESYDFLLQWGIKQGSFWKPKNGFQPFFMAFKKGVKFIDAESFGCYCRDSFVEMVYLLDPESLSFSIKEEDLK